MALSLPLLFGTFWAVVTIVFPTFIIKIFMSATNSVLSVSPTIMRKYCIGYLFAPFNLFATYYFQSILKAKISMAVSLSKGLLIGGILLYILPPLFGSSIWFAQPIAEILVAVVTAILIRKYTTQLTK